MFFSENMVNLWGIRFWSNYLLFELQLQKMFTFLAFWHGPYFLAFWKTGRKCWKNCALPVFFDNNNMKKEKSVSPLSFFLLRAWLWSLRVPLISIVQASKPTRRPRHFLCFQLCTVIPLDHIYTQAKFLKSLLKDLFAFCLTFLMVHSVV